MGARRPRSAPPAARRACCRGTSRPVSARRSGRARRRPGTPSSAQARAPPRTRRDRRGETSRGQCTPAFPLGDGGSAAGASSLSEQGFHAAEAGDDEARSQLGKRLEDEPALVQARVWDGQPRLVDLLVAVEEEVEVERARAVLAGHADTAEALLHVEQAVEELTRLERRVERSGAVEEARLLADPDRFRLAQRRDRHDLDPLSRAECVDRLAQRALAVAEVGPEADVRARHGLVTVAATVPSRSAGRTSGFRTRTRTRSAANRRSSSSATADASASSSAYCVASETSCTNRAR